MSKRRIVQERKTEKQIDKKESKKAVATPEAKGWKSMTNWLTALVFTLPLLFSRFTLDPTIAPRYIFLGSFLLLFFLYFNFIKKINFKFTSAAKIVFAFGIAFGAWSILSLTLAINPAAGYYEVARHFLNLVLLFVVFITIQNEESQILKICKAILLMSLIQSFVGILQYYDLAFEDIPGANAKPFGLMANRNLFGSAQALVLPFVIWVLYKGKKVWKYAAAIALSGIIISIVISQTRSAWLASVSILLSSLLLIIIFSKSNRKKWMICSLVSTGCIIALVSFLLIIDKENTLTQSVKERAVSLTQSGGKSETFENVNERIKIWKKSIELIKDKPVYGVGMGNWKIAIPAYSTEGLVWAYGAFVPDRPHNVYLQVASETGIPGGVLYFGVWLPVVIIALKIIIKRSHSNDKQVLAILMLSGLIAFAVDCMFSFPAERIEHTLYIFLMAGIILGLYPDSPTMNSEKKKPMIFLNGLTVLIIVLNLFMGVYKYNFEKHMNYAHAYDKEKRYQEVIDEVEAGKNPLVTVDQTGKSLEIYSSLAYDGLKDYESAIKEVNTAKKYNPNSAMVYNNLGTIYTDMKKYDSAINNYLVAAKLTPHFETVYKNLAVNYFNTENYSACIDALQKVNKKNQDSTLLNNLLTEAKRRLSLQK